MDHAHPPVLLVIAHGSRDPRHAATVHALAGQLRSLRPGLRVETGFLDFNAPSVPQLLDRLALEDVRDVIALPLLLTRAFHAKSDIPAVLREASARHPLLRIRQAEVLGPSPLLTVALERRLYEAGLTPADKGSTGVVLASAGSSDPEAIAVIAEIAREWRHTGWCAVRPAFASASLPVPRTRCARCARRAYGGSPSRRTSSPPASCRTASRPVPGRAARRCWPGCWAPPPSWHGCCCAGTTRGRRPRNASHRWRVPRSHAAQLTGRVLWGSRGPCDIPVLARADHRERQWHGGTVPYRHG